MCLVEEVSIVSHFYPSFPPRPAWYSDCRVPALHQPSAPPARLPHHIPRAAALPRHAAP